MSDLATNLAKADAYLARFRTDGVHNHIGGKAMPALDGTTFEIISPVDLKPLAQVAHGKAADVALASRKGERHRNGQSLGGNTHAVPHGHEHPTFGLSGIGHRNSAMRFAIAVVFQ